MRGPGKARVYLWLLTAIFAYFAYAGSLPRAERVFADGDGARQTRELRVPARAGYFVCLGAHESRAAAACESARQAKRGAAGAIYYMEGTYFAVAAAYGDEQGARRVCEALRRDEYPGAEIVALFSPAFGVRVTADGARLAAIESALAAADEFIDALDAIIANLDSPSGDLSTAREMTSAALTELRGARRALDAAISDSDNEFCVSLARLLASYDEGLSSPPYRASSECASALRAACVTAFIARHDFIMEMTGGG